MNSKAVTAIVLLGAALAFGFMLKLMHDMSGSMNRMTGHMETLSRDVASMNHTMSEMNAATAHMSESMDRMEKSVKGMGEAFGQGSKQMQQWNPGQMMQNVMPNSRR